MLPIVFFVTLQLKFGEKIRPGKEVPMASVVMMWGAAANLVSFHFHFMSNDICTFSPAYVTLKVRAVFEPGDESLQF